MSHRWQESECRLLELLADRVAFGLDGSEERELHQLLQAVPDFDTECLERVAATAQLACTTVEPLPPALRTRIRAQGARHFGPNAS